MELKEYNYFNQLLDLYGPLLTEQQRAIASDYYWLNLSFSEIGENRNISRAAVSDTVTTVRSKLAEYEEKLGLFRKKINIREQLAKIAAADQASQAELIAQLMEVI